MGVGALFVAARAGHGVPYYGGLLFFTFAVLFDFLLIKTSFDESREATSMAEFRDLVGKVSTTLKAAPSDQSIERITVRSIGVADLRDALARGFADFWVRPTHLIMLCVIYPVLGLLLSRLTFGYDVLPILFPLISGFALIGPLAATGIYELSRRREQGLDMSWWHVFDVLRSPSIHSIVVLGVIMAVIFVGWLFSAQAIYATYFGDRVPTSIADFAHQIFVDPAGWKLIVVGCGVGFVFAVGVLWVSVVSIPLLLDRNVGVARAIQTSVRAVFANPGTITVWGFIVAGALVAGSVPLFVGLAIALPVLGHSTWHLYRKLVVF